VIDIVDFLLYFGIIVNVFGILALSLNLQYGLTGLLNFGQVAFFAIGAYASAIATSKLGCSFIVGSLVGMGAAALFGLLICAPVAKLEDDYWAVITLAASEIVRITIMNAESITGGPYGLRNIPRPFAGLFENYSLTFFLLSAICLILVYLFAQTLTRSPFGRVLRAIREEEVFPVSFGKKTYFFKLQVVAVGGAIAGLAGSLYAHYLQFISPDYFIPLITFFIWSMVIVGGKGNNIGVILGVVAIQLIYVSSRFIKDYITLPGSFEGIRLLLIGLILILFMRFKQDGVLSEKKTSHQIDQQEATKLAGDSVGT
jgi:branched-chain amino acid transport system permease protein